MPTLSRRTPDPSQVSRRHVALVEAAVGRYAPKVWEVAAARLVRWLRRTLKEVRPELERTVFIRAVEDPEILYLQSLLETYRFDDAPLEELAPVVRELTTEVALEYGWLPNDPRFPQIKAYTTKLLEDDIFSFWRTLTDSETLAKRIVKLREEGLSYTEMTQRLADQYRASFYSAERLIRTSYNGAANYAHTEDLKRQGYTHKQWLTARDNRVRGGRGSKYNHRRMDKQLVAYRPALRDAPEGHRLLFPTDRTFGAPAGTIVHCRCTVIGVFNK